MDFSINQIQKIIQIIGKNQALFIGSTLGIQYLSDYDRFVLELNGIDIYSIQKMNDIERMFYFGIYSSILGGNKSYKTTGKQFDKWFEKEFKKPLSTQKKVALEFLRKRTYTDVVGLGNKISSNVSNRILTATVAEQNLLRGKIKRTTEQAFKQNKTSQQLASMLREVTQDWARDFSRIADYTMQEAYAYGRLAHIVETYGEECLVYKQTFPGVCKHCEKNYGTPNQEPVIYTIQELLSNGNNIGRKEQLPVVGQAHPWARSILHPVPPNSKWDDSQKRFIIQRTNKVKRNSKAKVTIT